MKQTDIQYLKINFENMSNEVIEKNKEDKYNKGTTIIP